MSPLEIIAAALAAAVTFALIVIGGRRAMRVVQARAVDVLKRASEEAARTVREAAETAQREIERLRSDFEREREESRRGTEEVDRLLRDREREVDRRSAEAHLLQRSVDKARRAVRQEKDQILSFEGEVKRVLGEQRAALLKGAGLSEEEAKRTILKRVEEDVRRESDARISAQLEQLKEDAERRARRVVTIAIERCNFNHFTNSFSNVVELPSADVRDRLVGKEKQNQVAFEEATGVTLVFDETNPSVVVLSAYDGTKKAVAKRALERLLSNGAIHPARIRDVVDKAQKELKRVTMDAGRQLCAELSVRSVHPEIIGLLGRLHFRTSYGQNQLAHIREVAFLAAIIAAELGLDAAVGKRCGLLHDIGKAVDSEVEGGHPEIGAEIAKRCGESNIVVNAIAAHHEDVDRISLFPIVAQVADAISGSRPGARRETLDRYLQHVEGLEAIAKSRPGVDTAFAIQAGREIRVLVDPQRVSDQETEALAKDIAREIEEKLTYPGKIRVLVVRESKVTATAH